MAGVNKEIQEQPAKELRPTFRKHLTEKSIRVLLSVILIDLSLSGLVFASSGNFLVALDAAQNRDFQVASTAYNAIIKPESDDIILYQDALVFSVLANNLERAVFLAKKLDGSDIKTPSSGFVLVADALARNEISTVTNLMSRYENLFPEFFVTLVSGWIDIALGSLDAGIAKFLSLDSQLNTFARYNISLALALSKDYKSASSYLEIVDDSFLPIDERQLLSKAQIFSQVNRNSEALSVLGNDLILKDQFLLADAAELLKSGETLPFDSFSSVSEAISNIFFLLGSVSREQENKLVPSIFYITLAKHISIHKDYYTIKLAEEFFALGIREATFDKFGQISNTSPMFLRAQLGIVDLLIQQNRHTEAIAKLKSLLNSGYDKYAVVDSLASVYRMDEQYEKAVFYYSKAVELISIAGLEEKWTTFFFRGISYDQAGNWKDAKSDLSRALELSPGHPEVLNYLGYSLIERKENLVGALEMIKKAVKKKPQSGYIVDSLGWCLFRLGRYEEAVAPMERAIELEPTDPIVNDHLGDVFWMVGRKREARFQWKRALLFGPTIENEKKINYKLLYGISDF